MKLTTVLRCIGELTKKYSNLPEAYIKKKTEWIVYQTPNERMYQKKKIQKKIYRYTMNRPWTEEFRQENRKLPKIWLEPIKEWSYFKGDLVEILEGKDKGKKGHICQIIQERHWVLVEGLNCKYTLKEESKDFPGKLIKEEQPLLINSEVALVDPEDNKPTKIEWRFTEDGTRVRVSIRTGRIIPMPKASEETIDYKTKSAYVEQEKDTKSKEVLNMTFFPKLKTFEMDIMDEMGIKETRIPCKTWWY